MSEGLLRVGFVGAGAVNFGRPEVPWDHASRLEKIGGVVVLAIADPNTRLAEEELARRQKSEDYGWMYKDCRLYSDATDLLPLKLDAVFIGIPPLYRGSSQHDIELKFVQAGVNVFVEKPLSLVVPEDFTQYSQDVTEACEKHNVVLSVGYMFRYHAAVLKMKELIKQHGGKVMAFNGRYYFAYTQGINPYWWNKDQSGGPVVEQLTHFCDLARYLVGDVDVSSIHTVCLKDSSPGDAGKLKHVPFDAEKDIPSEERIPRVTLSHWRFKDGGVGTVMHSIALPGTRYEANIDVQLDGLKLSLVEPYSTNNECVLRVRDMRSLDEDVVYEFGTDDPYALELSTFLQAIRGRDQRLIHSSYQDATETYKLTWAIRRTGEAS